MFLFRNIDHWGTALNKLVSYRVKRKFRGFLDYEFSEMFSMILLLLLLYFYRLYASYFYNFIPEPNLVSRVYRVAAVLCWQCGETVQPFPMTDVLYFYISTFPKCVRIVAVFCNSLLCFTVVVLRYCLNGFEMVSAAVILLVSLLF